LKYLDLWTRKRQAKAQNYNRLFEGNGLLDRVKIPVIEKKNTHTFHQYVIRVRPGDRKPLRDFLYEKGILTDIYYPLPLHLQECFAYLGYKEGSFPQAEKASGEVLALPVYPELSDQMQEYVVDSIKTFFRS
jgi:dTDP-4-amino-4,6-dideoxygalactose transaminase